MILHFIIKVNTLRAFYTIVRDFFFTQVTEAAKIKKCAALKNDAQGTPAIKQILPPEKEKREIKTRA